MWWLVIMAAVAYLVYLVTIKPMRYWEERNIPYSKPVPFLGNMAPLIFRKRSFVEVLKQLYSEFPDKRYIGVFQFTEPQLLIRDPELIKQVTIRDFEHFPDRTRPTNADMDPIFSKNLGSLHGKKWRDMRATLSPTFTSSKMRFMFTLTSECAERFTRYFDNKDSRVVNVEMKELYSRFTNDVIATTAFGVTVDSLKEKDNEFFLMGKSATDFGGLVALKFILFTMCPSLMKLLKISVFSTKLSHFFKRIVGETIEVREKNGILRPDMIHLLLETRKGKLAKDEEHCEGSEGFAVVEESTVDKEKISPKEPLTDDDITAQALIFFFAGFDTASTLMSFMSHELAVNPDIQEKLQREIDDVLEDCGGKVTYEAVLGMKYLDMVVSESLRKWPPGPALTRICVKDYVITPQSPNEKSLILEKGATVMIPVVALHSDPKYFPNPDKFDPERFNEENRSSIAPGTYLPFGIGPRSCIASRFGLMETKILFFHLLSKFDIVPIERTPIPLVLSRKKFNLAPDEGFWLGLKQRKIK